MSASAFNTLAHLDVENRRVLVRLDLDDEETLRPQSPDSSLSTLKELLHRGARVIVAGHRRARGQDQKLPSLRRCGSRLAQALDCPIHLPDEVVGDGVRKLIRDTRGGQIVLLENLDLDPREQQGSPELGRLLAELCDVYVLDAVQASLSDRASVVALAERMPDAARGIGHRVERHLEASKLLSRPDTGNNTLIFGSEKVELLSLAALAKLVELRASNHALVLGGALGRCFLELAQGHAEPKTLPVTPDLRAHMRSILEKIQHKQIKLLMAHDLETSEVPATEPSAGEPGETPPPKQPLVRLGPESRRDLISTLHVPHVAWVGPIQPGHGHQDEAWLAERLVQHPRDLIAVGAQPLRALAGPLSAAKPATEHLACYASCEQFVQAHLAKAPIPGLLAIAVQEQEDA